jgi:hypothetical protein
LKPPQKDMSTMDAVWVSGTLTALHAESGLGMAGYRLQAEIVAPYAKLMGKQ